MLLVAWREFASTVLTKGFIIGVVLTPVLIAVAVFGIMLSTRLKGPQVEGSLAVIDHSGKVASGIVDRFTPEALDAEKQHVAQSLNQAMDQAASEFPMDESQKAMAKGLGGQAVADAMDKIGRVRIEVLGPEVSEETIKDELGRADIHARSRDSSAPEPRVGLVVIPENALSPGAEGGYGGFSAYWADKVDFEIRERIQRRVGEAIIDARLMSDPRIATSGLSPPEVRALLERPRADEKIMTARGEKRGFGAAQVFIPMAFMGLLLISVMVSGQSLLTTTIEEKSSRVMEVLLSAVSPRQLLIGKILGQMGVGLLFLGIYSGMGIAALVAFSMRHLVDPLNIVYLFVFFFLGYFTIASMFAAIGSAVTELREAQTLMTPVMMFMIIPWILWFPLSRAPSSGFAVAMSFTPGLNPFAMMIRLAGSDPVPAWQTILAIAIGIGTAVLCAWAAAKVFRIGVLMYGKPPNLRTLIKWVRMA